MVEITTSLSFLFVILLVKIHDISCYVPVVCRPVHPGQKIYPCTREYNPMCGSNGKTYSNACGYCAEKFEKAKFGENWNVIIDHEGVCSTANPTNPSYPTSNGASTFFQNVISQYFPASTPTSGYPFFSTNRVNGGGQFTNAFWQFLNQGIQSPYQPQPYRANIFSGRSANCGPYGPVCSRYGVVCGSDGRVYSSECHLCLTSIRSGTNLRIIKDGYC